VELYILLSILFKSFDKHYNFLDKFLRFEMYGFEEIKSWWI